ncbi:MAG: pilus assembly FimT family protein [bacterium]
MSPKSHGFSLIEVLFVLALMGLVTSVCVLHFDSIQSAFSGGNTHPKAILEDAIQQGRLSAHQLHQPIRISIEEDTRFLLKSSSNETLQKFEVPKRDFAFQCKFLPGVLTPEGTFKHAENPCSEILINEEGFIASTFLDITYGEDHERYEIDSLTGELKPAQW